MTEDWNWEYRRLGQGIYTGIGIRESKMAPRRMAVAIVVLGALIGGALSLLSGCEPTGAPVLKTAQPASSPTTSPSAAAGAITVDLVRLACEPAGVVVSRSLGFADVSKPAPDSGTVNPGAKVMTIKTPAGGTIKMAVDSNDPKSKTFDVFRVDFTGKGKFANAEVVPAEVARRGSLVVIYSKAPSVEFTVAGKKRPFWFRAYVRIDESSPDTIGGFLDFGTALEGTFTLGGTQYKTRVHDANYNCVLGDKCQVSYQNGKMQGTDFGDLVVLGPVQKPGIRGLADLLRSRGEDANPWQPTVHAYYGHPMRIAGTWYKATLSSDQSKLVLAPVDVKTGQLSAGDGASGVLVGASNVQILGGAKVEDLPADKYAIWQLYGDIHRPKDQGTVAMLLCDWEKNPEGFVPKSLDIPAGQNVHLKLDPLRENLSAKVAADSVGFTHLLTHEFAGSTTLFVPPEGKRVPPTLTITDSDGKTVHSAKMEFG